MNRIIVCIFAMIAVPGACLAQAWPDRSVRIIVPYSAGSVVDSLARVLFNKVGENTGQTFIVDNRPGASAMLGTGVVARAKPDGSTLVFAAAGPLNVNALLFKKMPYDPFQDLTPVCSVAQGQLVLLVSESVKAKNMKELLAEVRANGAKMAYGSSGIGTQAHLAMADITRDTEIVHIPFSGSPQTVSGLISNNIQMALLPIEMAAAASRAHGLRAIATLGANRGSWMPDIPTFKEAGVNLSANGWMGVAAPGKTPSAVVEQIYKHIAVALKDQRVIDGFRQIGYDVLVRNPTEFRDFLLADYREWEPLIKRNNIALQ
ncbi:Bug family tripartite tricarboxylate transporter substrate binding protein [Pigmentiphaga kullae]|uniref:Tripartite-type tricarboxylate transporter receptor subunit TctC n=1 Tax=Pigmentiphaga kullae TaxID=151784 RepID=A0A4V2F473_9BURK|nr:tripartite tricarboxylate transporter substrate binding protein [Pigmentiphaga kullae]RZS86607.1 tripartite-type tricarboxylate transporter receptor subunit TctC [Pigmentiphaga kullae]